MILLSLDIGITTGYGIWEISWPPSPSISLRQVGDLYWDQVLDRDLPNLTNQKDETAVIGEFPVIIPRGTLSLRLYTVSKIIREVYPGILEVLPGVWKTDPRTTYLMKSILKNTRLSPHSQDAIGIGVWYYLDRSRNLEC